MRCCRASADYKITPRVPDAAKNSPNGLCRQAAVGLPVSRAVVTAMAISAAPPAFQRAPSLGAQFCALDSWLRHRSSRYAANSHRGWIVGARSRDRLVELAATPRLGHNPTAMGIGSIRSEEHTSELQS